MFRTYKKGLLYIALLISGFTFAQEREQDTLRTDVIDVVRPYAPTISDAFKVREIPDLSDTKKAEKQPVKYSISSVPVASTFTPAKGKAAGVEKAKKEKLYDNYAVFGTGTYASFLAELYVTQEISRGKAFSGHLKHHSSQNGVDNALNAVNFTDSELDLNYASREKNLSWLVNGGFAFKTNNWYGLNKELFNEITADTMALSQNYKNAYVSGNIQFDKAVVDKVDVLFRNFSDGTASGENRFKANGLADVSIMDYDLNVEGYVDYISGEFGDVPAANNGNKYGNVQFGIAPTYKMHMDGLALDIGVKAVYNNALEQGDSKLFIYPNILASYAVVDEVLSVFGGAKGGLKQNSFYEFSTINPFVSPDLIVAPTNQQYNVFAGLKGKFSSAISYELSGSYANEKGKALFINNPITQTQPYYFGNSFGVVYDEVKTVQANVALQYDLSKNFHLGVNGSYSTYNTKTQAEAWNLPGVKASTFVDYIINEKWQVGGSFFYVGSRKDQLLNNFAMLAAETKTLKSYFDANLNVNYTVNTQLSAFAKVQNVLGNQYEKWQNTNVQGIQVLVGGAYKFDF